MLILISGLFVRDEKTQLLQLKASSVYDFQASFLACVAVTPWSSLCSREDSGPAGSVLELWLQKERGHQPGCAATQEQSQPESSTAL